jgi:hypothetical protein
MLGEKDVYETIDESEIAILNNRDYEAEKSQSDLIGSIQLEISEGRISKEIGVKRLKFIAGINETDASEMLMDRI